MARSVCSPSGFTCAITRSSLYFRKLEKLRDVTVIQLREKYLRITLRRVEPVPADDFVLARQLSREQNAAYKKTTPRPRVNRDIIPPKHFNAFQYRFFMQI